MSSTTTSVPRAVYVPPAKRSSLARLSTTSRAPSTRRQTPPEATTTTTPTLDVASFPVPTCRKKTPLSRTLSRHSMLERQEQEEEAQVLTAIRVDAENPLWMVPLLDRAGKSEAAEKPKPVAIAAPRVVRAPSPLQKTAAAVAPAPVATNEFPTEKRRISIITDLPTFTSTGTRAGLRRYASPSSATSVNGDMIDISRPSSRASSRSATSDASSLFSAVSYSTSASSVFNSPISPFAKSPAKTQATARAFPTRTTSPCPSLTRSMGGSSESEGDVESESEAEEQAVVVVRDQSVKNYLYQGGKTNVLGGGVMLGPSKAATTTAPRNNKQQGQQWRKTSPIASPASATSNRRSALLSAIGGRIRTNNA